MSLTRVTHASHIMSLSRMRRPRQALRVDPSLVDVHNNLGDLWRAQGALGRGPAQQCYLEALRLEAGYAPAWRGLGDLLREGGECMQVRARPWPAAAAGSARAQGRRGRSSMHVCRSAPRLFAVHT